MTTTEERSPQSTGQAPTREVAQMALRALREPYLVWRVFNAQLSLRHCTRVPYTVRLRGRVMVVNYGIITLGDRVRLNGTTVRLELVAWDQGTIDIGPRTGINYGTSISAHKLVRIGSDCRIGTYVIMMDNDYHQMEDRDKPGDSEPIIIEDNVWIGSRAIVLKGVTIGRDSVVGAGSVVTRDVPPRCFVAGVPARLVRTLPQRVRQTGEGSSTHEP